MNAPSPLGAVLVKAIGAVPSQMVCSLPIVPGTKLSTVTFIILLSSVHALSPDVDVATLLYQVSWVRAGAA